MRQLAKQDNCTNGAKRTSPSVIKKVRAFGWRNHGNVAMMFGLAAIPLFGAAGLGLDGSRVMLARYELQGALDAAALAVGSTINDKVNMKTRLQKFTEQNYNVGGTSVPVVSLPVDNDEKVKATASLNVKTFFMPALGIKEVPIEVSTEISRSSSGLALSIVLDTTGSMSGQNKIQGARSAAKALIDILYGAEPGKTPEPSKTLLMSIVPYVTSVNIGDEALKIASTADQKLYKDFKSTGTGWKGCIVEPVTMAPMYNKTQPFGNLLSSSVTHAWDRFTHADSKCPSPITPLTNDYTRLHKAADILKPNGWGTLTDVGLAWGLRTLMPNSPFTQSQNNKDLKGDSVWDSKFWNKALVIMTDGQTVVGDSMPGSYDTKNSSRWNGLFGTSGGSWSGSEAVKQSNQNIETLCSKAKSAGILVYTVTFGSGAKTGAIRKIFDNCATSSEMAFHAPSNNDLKNQFKAIGNQLARLRISK